ncbi:unnamed protein product [Pieris macdunnoughi]|uniref:Uncharacterized protein n=1 Tax=Pieris macdunnoughi TaxID=345717 RepID=A0A821TMP2_9NEOP|nr:unnamed protein product [Pieris macdunnoughi]
MNSWEINYQSDSNENASVITIDGTVYNPPTYEAEAELQALPETPEIHPDNILYPNTIWFNAKPLNKFAKTYELEKFEKNLLIIFNQENIVGYEPRLGTEKDVTALINTFSQFGFEIETYKDKTKSFVLGVLRNFKYRNFSDYGCVAVVVLTHGTTEGLIRAKDQFYKEFDVIDAFKTYNNPSLITKPKLLFIQACRGKQSVKGVNVGTPTTLSIKKDECHIEPYTLPAESDMYVLHSSYMGKPSHRDEFNGTWLIQTLCKKINELAPTHDLASIVTEVKQEVAIDLCFEEYNTETLEVETNTQVPVDTSTLIRKLYFRKYGESVSYTDSRVERSDSITPLLEFGPCVCFLDYFAYITECLRLYLEHNPEDAIAQYFIEASETIDSSEMSGSKEKMTNAIVNYLRNHAKQFDFYKYMYFKK